MKSPYREYVGDEIITLSEHKEEPIVESILFENDYSMLIAEAKNGKTIFCQQLACNITSGTPFLGIFDVPRALPVWYIATEGKDEDLKDRFIRISKAVELNTDNLVLICSSSFRFNTVSGQRYIEELLEKHKDRLPKVIIIDALYRALKGDLNSNKDVNEFHNVVGKLADACDASVLIVHHMTKPQRNKDGDYQQRSDNDAYGSAFLMASVDQCYWLEKWYKTEDKLDRILRCDTQRGGDKIDSIRLRLIEPDPLYFVVVSKHDEEMKMIRNVLKHKNEGLNFNQLMIKCKIRKSTLYYALSDLVKYENIEKFGRGKYKMYRLKNQGKTDG